MYESNSKGISYTAGFFMLITFAIAGLILASALGMYIWGEMTGQDPKLFLEGLQNPAYANAYKVVQAITAVLSYLIPAIATAWLINRRPMELLGFTGRIRVNQAGLAILIILIALFIASGLAYFNRLIPIPDEWRVRFENWEADYTKQVEAISGLKTMSDYFIALIVLGFIPALCEETLFRGGLQNFLARSTRNYWFSIIIVSIIFSAAHASYYGFLSRFFLGLTLGLIYQYSGILWLSILAHFINNALALSVLYYFSVKGKSVTEATNDVNSGWWGIFLLPLFIGLVIYFRKVSDDSNNLNPQKTHGI
jgi:membrane protease YdiL (CAAX protease family)